MRIRLDQALVERGLCDSRERAKRAILAGQVRLNGQAASKPSDSVKTTDRVELAAPEKFVSRGGYKLEHALEHFKLDVTGLTAIDLGASTGGFTDCLLQRGAAKVYAVDVGQGQLAWKLRQDPRVAVMEKTNARELTPARFPPGFKPVDFVVADCSFISLRKIIPPAVALLRPSGRIVALIKPQFEAGKREVDRGAGVIRDSAVHERVLRELEEFVTQLEIETPGTPHLDPLPEREGTGKDSGPLERTISDASRTDNGNPLSLRVRGGFRLAWLGVTQSPILGPAGNKEFLALIEKNC